MHVAIVCAVNFSDASVSHHYCYVLVYFVFSLSLSLSLSFPPPFQLGTSLFGINQTPKLVNSWPAVQSGGSPTNYSNYVRLEWSGSRSVVLHMPGGVECKYSL